MIINYLITIQNTHNECIMLTLNELLERAIQIQKDTE